MKPGVSLGIEDVHLWCARTNDLEPLTDDFAAGLSPDERLRAKAFALPKDRDAFVRRRGLLRSILGRYLSLDPRHIGFRYGPYGKPALDPTLSPLTFSLSHSQGLVLCAVTRRATVGVDVELVVPRSDLDSISAQFLARDEADLDRALPEEDRLAGFYRRWTRQEAYLKATGGGLAAAPIRIEAGLEASAWKIESIVPAPGYVGALVAEGREWRLSWPDWPPPARTGAARPRSGHSATHPPDR